MKFVQDKPGSHQNPVLAFANRQAAGLPELRFAEQEVLSIAAFYARYYRTFPLFDTNATETAFKTLAPNYAILHLAAHAELNTVNPLFSRIRLSPDDQSDGALEVHEIYELPLEQTDLVVLSACDTKLGQLSRGDDLVGLTRAFLYAGAPSVIASLWKVDDLVTRDFMTAFYFFFAQNHSAADALRSAQRLTRSRYPHPYYWAAFTLVGRP